MEVLHTYEDAIVKGILEAPQKPPFDRPPNFREAAWRIFAAKSNPINGGKKKFLAKRERAFQDTLTLNGRLAGHRRYTSPRKDIPK